jgi:tetratricopeptide (TPR) repeat protein
MAQLPALNFGARSTSGDTESGDTKSGDTKSGDTASGAITVAVTSAENCEPESEPSEMIATVLDNIGQYQGDLPIPETTPVNYEDYFAANFTYVAADRGAFYESLRASYSRLGRVLLKRKELIESEDLLREALDISTTEKFAVKQPEDLMFLACLYLKQGKSWQSEKLLRQSLIILENTPDVSDRLIGLCHHRLALVYCHLSLLFKAERHFKKAVQMLTDSDKASLNRLTQRRLAAVLKDYAVLLNRMRRESEADQYYAQARKVLSSSILTG